MENEVVLQEIAEIKANCEKQLPSTKLISCTNWIVRVDIYPEKPNRLMTVCLRYPQGYPTTASILVELKSRVYSSKLMVDLTRLIDVYARDLLGKPHVLSVLRFVQNYLRDNPLCVCLDEIKQLRYDLNTTVASLDPSKISNNASTETDRLENSQLKLRQRNSSIEMTARGGPYIYRVTAIVPEAYPMECVQLRVQESNLPSVLVRFLNGQSREIARQCVEPPLRLSPEERARYQPVCSLYRALKFCLDATREFHAEICPVCEKQVLPTDPADVVQDDRDDNYIERVLCGHLFHQSCLKNYFASPPFPKGGKLCPAKRCHPRSDIPNRSALGQASGSKQLANNNKICGIRIASDRWAVNPKVAEARWAQKQARERELEEVIDFLQ